MIWFALFVLILVILGALIVVTNGEVITWIINWFVYWWF